MTNHTAIEWTAGSGAQIKVTLEIGYELDNQGRRRESGIKVIIPTLYINGKREFACQGIMTCDHPVAVASFGPVGIVQANYDRILAARADLESQIAEHNASIWAEVAKADEATAASRNLEAAMAYGQD
jgi:hypothetical protein